MSIISAITFTLLGAALGYFAARRIHPKVDNSELEQELEVTRENLKQQDVYWQQQKADSLELLDQLEQTYSKLTQHLKQDAAVNTSGATVVHESLSKPEVAEPIALAAISAATESEQKSQQAENETAREPEQDKKTGQDEVKTEKQTDAPVLTAVKSDDKVDTEVITEPQTPEKQRVNS